MESNLHKPKYWKSLNQLNNKPESAEVSAHEFQQGVTDDFDINQLPDKSRRKFLAVLGASAAFAATACSDYHDKGEIITYNKKPASVTNGQANYYATTLNNGLGVLVKSREGRPIKIDGNPEHLINQGKIDAASQASILDLYDPGRLRTPLRKSDSKLMLFREDMPAAQWDVIDKEMVDILKKASVAGKEIAIITSKIISPTQNKLFDDFVAKYPTTKVYSYQLINDSEKRKAWSDCYGTNQMPVTKYDAADVILALECDFIGTEGNNTENIRKYTSRRNVDDAKNFNKLYAVEADYSLTGACADVRLRLSPENQYAFVLALINELVHKHGKNSSIIPSNILSDLSQFSLSKIVDENKLNKKYVDELVKDLAEKSAKVLVTAGSQLPYQVHVAVNVLNEVLGSVQNVYDFKANDVIFRPLSSKGEIKDLVGKMNAGQVGVLINFDVNPVYHFPKNLGYENALSKVPTIVSLVESLNETCKNNSYILSINNALESWGDFKLRTGMLSTQQPLISPIHDTRQKEAILLNWLSEDVTKYNVDIYQKYLMDNWQKNLFPTLGLGLDFNSFWYSVLHDGFVSFNEAPAQYSPYNYSAFNSLLSNNAAFNKAKSGFTVILKPGQFLNDGKQANNGWILELPHPITKIVWDNCAAMSPETAKELKVQYGEDAKNLISDFIEVKIGDRKLKLPIVVLPGMADKVISVQLGYGRTNAGEVGNGVGFNAGLLMSFEGDVSDWIYTGAIVTKANETYTLVSTQEHHSLDDAFVKDVHKKRHIIQEYQVPHYMEFEKKYEEAKKKLEEEYKDKPDEFKKALKSEKLHLLGHHEYLTHSVYPPFEYTGVKWAMAIDMNKCIACNVCVTACNAENNVPIVGKDECSKGREMHWMRIDTYFSGTPEEPETSMQPMLCQHCDQAPCENVCPVVATSHSTDGLNQMVYNRCVGTRYCSNNCPYKVRRYNFFDFRNDFADGYYRKDTLELLHNPEVTVRSRGVMEKCSFCVQRIQEGRQNALKEGRTIVGTDVKTACQEACPSAAITFGDMNDAKSELSRLREHKIGYQVLETINIRPNVTYIARLRNNNSEGEQGEH
jgi:molybdopterin-containing oxidoreductase family iron-sulfur binding subunit